MLNVHSHPQPQDETLSGSGIQSGPRIQSGLPMQQSCRENLPAVSAPDVVAGSDGFLAPDIRLLQEDMYRPAKKRRTGFEVQVEPISDFISKGLITMDYAIECFTTYVHAICAWRLIH